MGVCVGLLTNGMYDGDGFNLEFWDFDDGFRGSGSSAYMYIFLFGSLQDNHVHTTMWEICAHKKLTPSINLGTYLEGSNART